MYRDTHAHPVSDEITHLATALRRRVEAPILLERDRDFGQRSELEAELDALEVAMAQGDALRRAGDGSSDAA